VVANDDFMIDAKESYYDRQGER